VKILFLSKGYEDYLRLGLLHGLRQLDGIICIDVPKLIPAYKTAFTSPTIQYRGRGFSLYGLLDDDNTIQNERDCWQGNIHSFDLIILTDIASSWSQIKVLKKMMKPGAKLAIIDAGDTTSLFPFEAIGNNLSNKTGAFFQSFRNIPWFKREWVPGKGMGTAGNYLPNVMVDTFEKLYLLKPVSFCFPKQKITRVSYQQKSKDFNFQVVDEAVASMLGSVAAFNPLRSDSYVFETEADYYHDLQVSRFGITTMRAGWDCLRHYEMAANGCLLCFKDLEEKPFTCAPHGLNRENCIIYKSPEDLMNQIEMMSEEKYNAMLDRSYTWIEHQTTDKRALEILQNIFDNLN
jgi:hypothetical protein